MRLLLAAALAGLAVAESGFRLVTSEDMFNYQVVGELRPTVLLVVSSADKACVECEVALRDYQIAAEQVKGHVRFGAIDVADKRWPGALAYLKSKLGLDPAKYPLPVVVAFGSPQVDEKGQTGRSGRLYNGPRTVDGFKQLAAQSLPDVHAVKSKAELAKVQGDKKTTTVVLVSNKSKATPFIRSLAFALSPMATLVIGDAGEPLDDDGKALMESLGVEVPLKDPTMVVLPITGSAPARFKASQDVDEMVHAVSNAISPPKPNKPKEANKEEEKPSTKSKKKEPKGPLWMLGAGGEVNQTVLDSVVDSKPATLLAVRLSGNESEPVGFNETWSQLAVVGMNAYVIHCTPANLVSLSVCQGDGLLHSWTYRVYPHDRAKGSAPYTLTTLDAAQTKTRESLIGQLAVLSHAAQKDYFGTVARQWMEPSQGRIALIAFGKMPQADTDALFAFHQVFSEIFTAVWFPDATQADLADLGITDALPLPLVAAFLPVLEDPPPPKGYQFKVAYYEMERGVHFDLLSMFGLGLLESMDKKRYDAFVDGGGMERHLNRELAGLFRQRRQREIDAVPKPPKVVQFTSKADVDKHCPSTCIVTVGNPEHASVLGEARELATAKMLGAVQYAWMGASCNLDLVGKMGLDPTMLPAVVVWNNVKRTVSAPMRGAFAKDTLVDFARRHKQGKIPAVSPVPAGLDEVKECSAEDVLGLSGSGAGGQAAVEESGEVDDLMREMRLEAEREQQRKEELAKQAAEEAKRLKKEKELEAKRRREEMNRAADAETKASSQKKKSEL